MFVGLPGPDPDPVIRGMDPDPVLDTNLSTFLLLSSKNSKKNLDSYCFVTSFGKTFLKLVFVGVLKVNDENSRIRIRIRIH